MKTHIEEVIRPSKLLEHLQGHDKQSAIKCFPLGSEAISPSCLDSGLVFQGIFHVSELYLDRELGNLACERSMAHLTMDPPVIVSFMIWDTSRFCKGTFRLWELVASS